MGVSCILKAATRPLGHAAKRRVEHREWTVREGIGLRVSKRDGVEGVQDRQLIWPPPYGHGARPACGLGLLDANRSLPPASQMSPDQRPNGILGAGTLHLFPGRLDFQKCSPRLASLASLAALALKHRFKGR